MKKCLLVTILLLVLSMLTTGCQQHANNPVPSTVPKSSSSSPTQVPSSTNTAVTQPNTVVLGGDHSNWISRQDQSGAMSCTGYYYLTKDGFLYFADRKSGTSIRLCSDVACLHEDEPDPMVREECEAFIGGTSLTPMLFYDDHLYYILEDGYGTHLWQRNAVGMEEKKITSLGKEYTDKQYSILPFYYAISGGYLYYDASVNGLEELEPNVFQATDEGYYIGQIHLATGKERILCYSKTEAYTLLACREEGVLIFTTKIPDAEYGTEEHEEQVQNNSHQLQYYDCGSGEISLLFDKPAKEFNAPTTLIGSKVIYYNQDRNSSCYYYDLTDGSCGTFNEGALVKLTDRYVIHTDRKTNARSVLDLETGTSLPYDMSSPVRVEDNTGDYLVLSYAKKESNGDRFRHYLFVELNTLSDGLQLTDGLEFYTLAYDRIS